MSPAAHADPTKRNRLVTALRSPTPVMQRRLAELKKNGTKGLERRDFVWHYLLQSFATMGNSRGWQGLIQNSQNYQAVTYERLTRLSSQERLGHLEQVLRRAKVRMPSRKARWLCRNLERIDEMGGLAEARKRAFGAEDRVGKIEFMKQFDGIGDKYARNIWMDVYHPDFRNAIAVDERIKRISGALGVVFDSYEDHERFYQHIAASAGREAWEVDRLLYWFRDDFLKTISGEAASEQSAQGRLYP